MRGASLLALAVWWAGCDRPGPRTPADAGAGVAPTASAPARLDAGVGQATLTADALDRFIRYQQQLHEAWAGAMSGPGGTKAALRARVAAEQQLRAASGLGEEELAQLDRMVNQVMARRAMLASVDYDGLIGQHEQLVARLPPESREAVQRQIDGLRKTRDELTLLAAERELFGSRNVDLLLTREKELLKGWNRMLQLWAGPKP